MGESKAVKYPTEEEFRLKVKEFLNDDTHVGSAIRAFAPDTTRYTDEALQCDDLSNFHTDYVGDDFSLHISDCYRTISLELNPNGKRERYKQCMSKLDILIDVLTQLREALMGERKNYRRRLHHKERLEAEKKRKEKEQAAVAKKDRGERIRRERAAKPEAA